jgi:hypothetical protein
MWVNFSRFSKAFFAFLNPILSVAGYDAVSAVDTRNGIQMRRSRPQTSFKFPTQEFNDIATVRNKFQSVEKFSFQSKERERASERDKSLSLKRDIIIRLGNISAEIAIDNL